MNYLFYRRIRGPVYLLTFGVTAALHQWHVLSFGRSWPLYLIVYGVLRLVEGAALAASSASVYPAAPDYAAQTYAQPGYAGSGYQPVAPPAAPGTALTTVTAAAAPPVIHTSAPTQEES